MGSILWDDGDATVDGVDVYEVSRYMTGQGTFVSQIRHSGLFACTAIHTDRDVAARAVAVAVKSMRGELASSTQKEIDRLCGLVNAEMADAQKWERRATEQVQEIIELRKKLAAAEQVAATLAAYGHGPIVFGTPADLWSRACVTALAYNASGLPPPPPKEK